MDHIPVKVSLRFLTDVVKILDNDDRLIEHLKLNIFNECRHWELYDIQKDIREIIEALRRVIREPDKYR